MLFLGHKIHQQSIASIKLSPNKLEFLWHRIMALRGLIMQYGGARPPVTHISLLITLIRSDWLDLPTLYIKSIWLNPDNIFQLSSLKAVYQIISYSYKWLFWKSWNFLLSTRWHLKFSLFRIFTSATFFWRNACFNHGTARHWLLLELISCSLFQY